MQIVKMLFCMPLTGIEKLGKGMGQGYIIAHSTQKLIGMVSTAGDPLMDSSHVNNFF